MSYSNLYFNTVFNHSSVTIYESYFNMIVGFFFKRFYSCVFIVLSTNQ